MQVHPDLDMQPWPIAIQGLELPKREDMAIIDRGTPRITLFTVILAKTETLMIPQMCGDGRIKITSMSASKGTKIETKMAIKFHLGPHTGLMGAIVDQLTEEATQGTSESAPLRAISLERRKSEPTQPTRSCQGLSGAVYCLCQHR